MTTRSYFFPHYPVVSSSMDTHRLSLIVESICLADYEEFTVSIRIYGSDWTTTGCFHGGVLPAGASCPYTPSGVSNKAGTIHFDLKVHCISGDFSGTCFIVKTPGASEFRVYGSTILYNESLENRDNQLSMIILIASEQVYPLISPQMREIQSQTDSPLSRDIACQSFQSMMEDKEVATLNRVVNEKELGDVVVRVIRRSMVKGKRRLQEQELRQNHPPDPVPSNKTNFGMNIVPRLQRLTLLDQMITNRERLLGAMETRLRVSDMQRKMQIIKSCRREDASIEKKEKLDEDQEKKEREIEESSFETEKTSTSSSSTMEVSSSSSSEKESSSNSIYDSFSSDETSPSTHLSPTSEYIKNLREQILRERMPN